MQSRDVHFPSQRRSVPGGAVAALRVERAREVGHALYRLETVEHLLHVGHLRGVLRPDERTHDDAPEPGAGEVIEEADLVVDADVD